MSPKARRPGLARSALPTIFAACTCLVAGLAATPVPSAWALDGPPPTPATEISLTARSLGEVSPYVFGANLLWPYNAEGAFDPAAGRFYPAFVDQAEQMGIAALRYPAGITADSFQWQRAIGPQGQRQVNEPYGMQDGTLSSVCCTLDGPAKSTVGPDEFGHLLDQLGGAGNIVVNFDTGTAQQAADWVAYMTAPEGEQPSSSPDDAGYWSKLRARNGHPTPYNVPYWEVGNEQDGRGQWGWRSGQLVAIGPHTTPCPSADTGMCLYAYGGTTQFSNQPMGTFADTEPQAAYSDGTANQKFYVYFPPVVPGTESVLVGGQPWSPVATFAGTGPTSEVYTFDSTTGTVTFGNGNQGAVPPAGARVTVTYQSGPHGGFVQFYKAMKAMNPGIQVCESEEASVAFLKTMGGAYPYDCVELHKYAAPADVGAPMDQYEEDLLGYPIKQGAEVNKLEKQVKKYSGRDVPVVITEYGQLVVPVPDADPQFNLSLDEGLLVGAQLEQWISAGVPLAEKYLLASTPFPGGQDAAKLALDVNGLSIDSAMIAGPSPDFVQEPSGQVIGLMSQLAGARLIASSVSDDPVMAPYAKDDVPVLQAVAADANGKLYLVVVNASPTQPVPTTIDTGPLAHGNTATVTVLDGPSPTSYNVPGQAPAVVTTVKKDLVRSGDFAWTFPAHSVSLIELAAQAGGVSPSVSTTTRR